MTSASGWSQRWANILGWKCVRTFVSYSRDVAVGDRLLLRMKDDASRQIFTKPLRPGKKFETRWGTFMHESLIGRTTRDIVKSSTGKDFRIHFPTLEEYVLLTPRFVTPVYPADANLIVSLLDIHVTSDKSQHDDIPLEILEAGTGHGALTLHLARAIHGANSLPRPELLENTLGPSTASSSADLAGVAEDIKDLTNTTLLGNEACDSNILSRNALQDWNSKRGAVIHSIDVSPEYSQHAKRIFYGFRQGMYARDADFYVGDVSEWINQQIARRSVGIPKETPEPFLSHAILDLPASHRHVAKAASVLHLDGVLLVFNPSITQIMVCVNTVREKKLPLVLDRIVELGAGMTGGREWDIRAVKPRALLRLEKVKKAAVDDNTESRLDGDLGQLEDNKMQPAAGDERDTEALQPEEAGYEMICRPKVGARVVGGGFVAVWRKMKYL